MGDLKPIVFNSPERIEKNLMERWIAFLDVTPKTIETYKKGIRSFANFLQEQGIAHPERKDVLAYRDHLKESHKPSTVQNYMSVVKLFFQWTAQEGFYPNIAEHVKGAKVDPDHKKDYLTSNQVNRVLNRIDRSTLKGKRDYAMIATMVTTGLRTISISTANVGDIKAVGDSMGLYYRGKGHEEKAVYVKIADPVEEAIREYLHCRGGGTQSEPLFQSAARRNTGGRMTTRSISRIVKNRFLEAGLNSERLTAHSLRHTAATLNLLNGGTVEETQQLLDHRNINTTLIYSHALERAKNDSELRISNTIFGKNE